MDKTVNKIGFTFFNAITHYILYRIVIFFLVTLTNAGFKLIKSIFRRSECGKKSVGTSSSVITITRGA